MTIDCRWFAPLIIATVFFVGCTEGQDAITPVPREVDQGIIVFDPPAASNEDLSSTASPTSEEPAASETETPPLDRPTDTPLPTSTTRVRPTATDVPCSFRPSGEFVTIWSRYADNLGCPAYAMPRPITDAEQEFQNGHMFWRRDADVYYVIYDGSGSTSGQWQYFDSSYGITGDNGILATCPETPPSGFFKPTMGFGNVWCASGGRNARIGWAVDSEFGFDGLAQVQDFQRGVIFQDSAGVVDRMVYLLFDTGEFMRVAL